MSKSVKFAVLHGEADKNQAGVHQRQPATKGLTASLHEIKSTDEFYLCELDKILLYEPDTATVAAVEAIKAAHARLNTLTISDIKVWPGQLHHAYRKYLDAFKYDPEDNERYAYLKKRPFTRLNYLGKMIAKMEVAIDSPLGGSALTEIASEARHTIQRQIDQVDSTRFYFNKVRSFDAFQPVSASFDTSSIVQRELFDFQLLLPSQKWSSKITVELLILADNTLAICSLEHPGRALMFPVFRRGDLQIDQSVSPLLTGSPNRKKTIKHNLVMSCDNKYIRLLSSNNETLRSWEWKLRQLLRTHAYHTLADSISSAGSFNSTDGLGISMNTSTPRSTASHRTRPPPRNTSSRKSLSSVSHSSSFKRLSLLLGDETFELSEQLKDILDLDEDVQSQSNATTLGEDPSNSSFCTPTKPTTIYHHGLATPVESPDRENSHENSQNNGNVKPDRAKAQTKGEVDKQGQQEEKQRQRRRQGQGLEQEEYEDEEANSRLREGSLRLKLNPTSSLYMYDTDDVDFNDKLSSAPPSNPPEFLPLPDTPNLSCRSSQSGDAQQSVSHPPHPTEAPPPLPSSATADSKLSAIVLNHEDSSNSVANDSEPLLSPTRDSPKQELHEVRRARKLLQKRLHSQNNGHGSKSSSDSPSILSGFQQPEWSRDTEFIRSFHDSQIKPSESDDSIAASQNSIASSVEFLRTPHQKALENQNLQQISLAAPAAQQNAKSSKEQHNNTTSSPVFSWRGSKKNKDLNSNSLVRRVKGSLKKAISARKNIKSGPSFEYLDPPFPVYHQDNKETTDLPTTPPPSLPSNSSLVEIASPEEEPSSVDQDKLKPAGGSIFSEATSATSGGRSRNGSASSYLSAPSSVFSADMPSVTTPNDQTPVVTLFRGLAYLSKWDQQRWNGLSDGEVPVQVSVSGEGGVIYASNWAKLNLIPKQEIRKSTAHDVQISQDTRATMFRFRSPEAADRFYEALELSRVDVRQQPLLYYHRQGTSNPPSLNSNDSSLGSLSSLEPPNKKNMVYPRRTISRQNSFNTVSTIFEEDEDEEEGSSASNLSSSSSSSSSTNSMDSEGQSLGTVAGPRNSTPSTHSGFEQSGAPQLLLLNNLRCKLHGVDIQGKWTQGELGRLSVFSVENSNEKAVLIRPHSSREPMFFEQSMSSKCFARIGRVGISMTLDDNPPRWLLQFKGEKEAAHVHELFTNA